MLGNTDRYKTERMIECVPINLKKNIKQWKKQHTQTLSSKGLEGIIYLLTHKVPMINKAIKKFTLKSKSRHTDVART